MAQNVTIDSNSKNQIFDYVVIGGGIFGIYTALHLSKSSASILLIEKDQQLFQRASAINQARLHGGYHYPRSIATAQTSHEHKTRFMNEHRESVNHQFNQYYGIDKRSSFTSQNQFETFCNFLNIPLREVSIPSYFNASQFEGFYLTEEYSFDPVSLANYYISKITANRDIEVRTNTVIKSVEKSSKIWELRLQNKASSEELHISSRSIINATYSSTNSINSLFGLENIPMMHEITEVVIASSSLKGVGLTVIDGDFASFMPHGFSDQISLSSVRYTSHYKFEGDYPTFYCQRLNADCTPLDCRTCNTCLARPASNQNKMMNQIGKYLSSDIKFTYLYSMYTIKSKLKSSYIDDSRPTLICKLNQHPEFHCIFGGKISSVYEIEKHFNV